MSISWKVLAAAAAVTAVLSGCSSVSLDEGNKAGTLAGEQSAAQTAAVNPFLDPANPLYHRSVYFAFDSYEVSPEYAAVVEAHAKWLAANPEVKIVIQGNTDERGGRLTIRAHKRWACAPQSSHKRAVGRRETRSAK